MCGLQQQVILRMHDREQAAQNLAAVQMELDDLASDLLLGETSASYYPAHSFCMWAFHSSQQQRYHLSSKALVLADNTQPTSCIPVSPPGPSSRHILTLGCHVSQSTVAQGESVRT